MKYVLDASVAVKWVITEADTRQALQLWDDSQNGVHELIVPDIFPVEMAHALRRGERQGRIVIGDAVMFMADLLDGLPQTFASPPSSREPWNFRRRPGLVSTIVSPAPWPSGKAVHWSRPMTDW